MDVFVRDLRLDVVQALRDVADPDRARGQQAYMKSEMPFHGVTVPVVRKLVAETVRSLPLPDAATWEQAVLALWRSAERREERYAAVELLNHSRHRRWLEPARMAMIEELVVTGAWWDYVDAIASVAVGQMLNRHPTEVAVLLRRWADDVDIWKRRTAILSQLKRGKSTDEALLFAFIEPSIDEREFFLRKAIGWALRQYSRVNPDAVTAYVERHASRLSALSKREALKALLKSGAVAQIP
ncbi:MAG: DNA alkylation repair protein [Gammaproteobacteria bacterium]|nr:DNA alkylation repair protein [Gammaproteobacteria bacterium]